MIDRVYWRNKYGDVTNPFDNQSKGRPLRFTFHNTSFPQANLEEQLAITTLVGFTHLPEIEGIFTYPGELPHIEIDQFHEDDEPLLAEVRFNEDNARAVGIFQPIKWHQLALTLVEQPEKTNFQKLFEVILLTRAHVEFEFDIFVTLSPFLLKHRNHKLLREANIFSPLEAVQLAGLFLRLNDNWTWVVASKFTAKLDRTLFFLGLTRHKLPAMWRYFHACILAEKELGGDIVQLGQSIQVRCFRALEALDAIGGQFYKTQHNDIRDVMMYHFEYLTLLLMGAFDAEARVAFRVYNLPGSEQFAGFQKKKYLKGLEENGAESLAKLAYSQRFTSILILLKELRNTIHGASMPTTGFRTGDEPEASLIRVLPQYSNALIEAAAAVSSPDDWGFFRLGSEWFFEPYTYSTMLVKESLKLVNEIAFITDITKLFRQDKIPVLRDGPPEDELFSEKMGRHLSMLAGHGLRRFNWAGNL